MKKKSIKDTRKKAVGHGNKSIYPPIEVWEEP